MSYLTTNITRSQLDAIETPAATNSYGPVPYSRLVDTIVAETESRGYEIDGLKLEIHSGSATKSRGCQLYGELALSGGPSDLETNGLTASLGFRSSHDKTLSVGFVAGSRVTICSNGLFSGDIIELRKHSPNVWNDIERLLNKALDILPLERAQALELQHQLTAVSVTSPGPREAEFVISAFDAKLITASDIPRVLEEFRSPSFAYDFEFLTLFSMFNALTHVLKRHNPLHASETFIAATAHARKFADRF